MRIGYSTTYLHTPHDEALRAFLHFGTDPMLHLRHFSLKISILNVGPLLSSYSHNRGLLKSVFCRRYEVLARPESSSIMLYYCCFAPCTHMWGTLKLTDFVMGFCRDKQSFFQIICWPGSELAIMCEVILTLCSSDLLPSRVFFFFNYPTIMLTVEQSTY